VYISFSRIPRPLSDPLSCRFSRLEHSFARAPGQHALALGLHGATLRRSGRSHTGKQSGLERRHTVARRQVRKHGWVLALAVGTQSGADDGSQPPRAYEQRRIIGLGCEHILDSYIFLDRKLLTGEHAQSKRRIDRYASNAIRRCTIASSDAVAIFRYSWMKSEDDLTRTDALFNK
jgi:hypothetical protein